MGTDMAQNTNSFEKRRKEIEKKKKADKKRERRHARKSGIEIPEDSPPPPTEGE